MPSLNSPRAEEDAPLTKLPFGELTALFWLVVRAVAAPDPVADVSNENSSVGAGRCREGLGLALGFGV